MYTPDYYSKLNIANTSINPSTVKVRGTAAFRYWERSLFFRACSTIKFNIPEEWEGEGLEFLYYCLFTFGYVAVFKHDKFGFTFQPCNLSGKLNWYYRPTIATISNPQYKASLKIGEQCEILTLTPDYRGIFDIIDYYAGKLALLSGAIDMSLINNKFAYLIGVKNKAAGEAIKTALDMINEGEPAVVLDKVLPNDSDSESEPWQFLERKDLKSSYLTTDQLRDFQTILNEFDTEIGIPTIPYDKKERMVTNEADSKKYDAISKITTWVTCLNNSCDRINNMFNTKLSASIRFDDIMKEGEVNDSEDTTV